MTHEEILQATYSIIADTLDMESDELTANTYVMRDLPTESIDLLEYGVALNAKFKIQVKDAVVFLKDFRMHCEQAKQQGINEVEALSQSYPHLTKERLQEMLEDLENGPVMQVRDIATYVEHALS